MNDVREFAHTHDLVDILPHLEKGALVAQAPQNFERISVLTEEDKQVLRHEQTHRWSHPLRLYITIIICSIGAAVQ